MKFTYFAGRYVAVEKPENCEMRNLTAHAISSAYETDGTFTCVTNVMSRFTVWWKKQLRQIWSVCIPTVRQLSDLHGRSRII